LGGWEGYGLGTVGRWEADPEQERSGPEIWLELIPLRDRVKRCSGCGQEVSEVHDVQMRWVRELPILDMTTRLLVHRCRLACPRCGPKLEELSWLTRYSRVTRRLAESVVRLCRLLPIKHVAGFYGLSWSTVKAIDKAFLEETLGPVDVSGVEMIAMDEFAIQKGHRYATVIIDPRTKVRCGSVGDVAARTFGRSSSCWASKVASS
jgi:transposase